MSEAVYAGVDWNEYKCFVDGKGSVLQLNYEELLKASLPIAYNYLYSNYRRFVWLKDDIAQECAIRCMDVFANYDIEKGFSVFSMLCVRYKSCIVRYLFSKGYVNSHQSLDSDISLDKNGFLVLQDVLTYYDQYNEIDLTMLNEKQRHIVFYLLSGYTHMETARLIGFHIWPYLKDIRLKLSDYLEFTGGLKRVKDLPLKEQVLARRNSQRAYQQKNKEKLRDYMREYMRNKKAAK